MNPIEPNPDSTSGLVRFPALVVSDLHLAHPATFFVDPHHLRPLLAGFRTVIFNGDTAELLSLKHRGEGRDKLQKIAEVCVSAGAKPLFLTGNHDPTVSTLHHLDLWDGRLFITHGDALHPWLAPWSRDAVYLKRERKRLLQHRPAPETWDGTVRLAKDIAAIASRYDIVGKRGLAARGLMVGKFAVQPWRAVHALYYWSNVVHYAHGIQRRFRPAAKLMLIGHTHRAGVWRLPDFTLINTGSYQPMSKPRAVVLEESERATVHAVVRGAAGYELGKTLHVYEAASANVPSG